MTVEAPIPLAPLQIVPLLDILASDDIRIHGHRIGIEHIVYAFNSGETPEEIVLRFPGIELRTVYLLVAYYLTNRGQIDEYIERLEQSSIESREVWERSRTPTSRLIGVVLRERAEANYTP
ncbi:MAG: DUF433 domain-containing protein [Caldilinea sp.]|uniref:DUF433 domain-containing protein n=1 Tax=Caldilinea sp. TaxID=2293560 RepID=UPI002B9130C6|nr:DUF433 domain-containing protein [Anaerolineales bacterium]HQY92224.1 DUF433 domain-containing protein [Caldilinea sp.]